MQVRVSRKLHDPNYASAPSYPRHRLEDTGQAVRPYRPLSAAGKPKVIGTTAIACYAPGFMRAIILKYNSTGLNSLTMEPARAHGGRQACYKPVLPIRRVLNKVD